MAKPISFTKRDLEKKKQEKRLAKQQKKEERKNTKFFIDFIFSIFSLKFWWWGVFFSPSTFTRMTNSYVSREGQI